MNDANTTFGPEACAERREDIALYAAGTLPPDEAQQLEAHFEAHPACRELLEAHRRVLKLVHEESLPGDAVDQAKVLRELKRRMAVESRVSLVPAQAALSRRGRIVWFVAILAVVMGIGAGIAVSTYTPSDGPVGPEGPIGPKPVATYYAPGSAQGKPVAAGDSIEAKGGIVRIVFTGGAEARLRDGSAARITGAKDMELLAGEAAVNVPKGRGGFSASAGKVRVEAPDTPGSRFLLALREREAEVVVAEGQVKVRGTGDDILDAEAGTTVTLKANGELEAIVGFNMPEAFEWVMASTSSSLRCQLSTEGPEDGKVQHLVASIENIGERTVHVARFHPMGVNYQISHVTAPGVTFTKINPTEVRKRKKDSTVETVRQISGTLALAPGDRYELEIALGDSEGKSSVMTFHYMSFGEEAEGGGWGFALKSDPLKIVEPAPEKKTPPKDGGAKTP